MIYPQTNLWKRNQLLNLIQEVSVLPKKRILIAFSAADIHFSVKAITPNVIKYWNDDYGIYGELTVQT